MRASGAVPALLTLLLLGVSPVFGRYYEHPPEVALHAPPPSKLAQKVQADINSAIARGVPAFQLPEGEIRFNGAFFRIDNATNMVISGGDNTTLIFYCGFGTTLSGAVSSTFQHVKIDYDPPCFAQGVINSTDGFNQTHSFVADFDSSFVMPDPKLTPIFNAALAKIIYWDMASGNLAPQGGVRHLSITQPVAGGPRGRYNITMRDGFETQPHAGLGVTISPRIGSTFLLNNCSHTRVLNTTAYAGGNMIFVEEGGVGGSVFDGVRLIRNPGRRPPQLLTGNADAFHSSGTEVGPTLVNSLFEYPGDDFYNCHNKLAVMWRATDKTNTTIYAVDSAGLPSSTLARTVPGDVLRFFGLKDIAPHGSATVRSIQAVNDPQLQAEAKLIWHNLTEPPYNFGFAANFTADLYEIAFETPVAAGAFSLGTLINSDRVVGAGAVVENTHFRQGYDSWMKVKCYNSTITNNLFEAAHGIHVFTEPHWMEGAAAVSNVYIAHNTLVGDGMSPFDIGDGVRNVTTKPNTIKP